MIPYTVPTSYSDIPYEYKYKYIYIYICIYIYIFIYMSGGPKFLFGQGALFPYSGP